MNAIATRPDAGELGDRATRRDRAATRATLGERCVMAPYRLLLEESLDCQCRALEDCELTTGPVPQQ